MPVYVNKDWHAVPERHQGLIREVLRIYCERLNKLGAESDGEPGFLFEPAMFLDPEVNEFAAVTVAFLREVGNPAKYDTRLYMELVPYDGDDGGPATLYVHAERDTHTEKTGRKRKGSYEETWDVAEYRDKGPNVVVKLDPPRKVEFTYEERRTVVDDTYYIHLITQEFDTYFTEIYNASEKEEQSAS